MGTSPSNRTTMKKITFLTWAFWVSMNALSAQDNNQGAAMAQDNNQLNGETVVPRNNIMVGAGGVNFVYMAVRNADKLKDSINGVFAGITTNTVQPLYYLKYECKLGKRHTLGLNFANSGFTLGGLLRDSFFINDMGLLTQTSVKVTYRSRSWNLRYNYLFNTNESFQVYWGLGIGLRGNSLSIKANDPNLGKNLAIPNIPLASLPILGFESTLGFRGLIDNKLGWYAEMGFAKSVFQAGLSYKF